MASISSSSSATVRVEKATSEFLIGPDWTLNIDICDAVNSNQTLAKDVVKAVKKRLQHKNPNVQLLALTLLETMVKNCGDYVHFQIAERNILQEMVKIVKKKTDMRVRDEILSLIGSWHEAFGGASGRYPQYYMAYEDLRRFGVEFPRRPPDAAPILTPPVTQPILRHPQPAYPMPGHPPPGYQISGYPQPGYPVSGHPQPGYGMPSSSSTRLDEAMAAEGNLSLSSLNAMRDVLDLLADMLQAVDPNDRSAVKNEVIVDLVEQCRANQKKLMQLLATTGDEELLGQGLDLNDSLQIVLARHDAIASGSPLPPEVTNTTAGPSDKHSSSPKPAGVSTPNATSNDNNTPSAPVLPAQKGLIDEEEEEDDDFALLARRHSRPHTDVSQNMSVPKSDVGPSATPSGPAATSNAIVPITPSPPVHTQDQDIIDLLSITLSTATTSDQTSQVPTPPMQTPSQIPSTSQPTTFSSEAYPGHPGVAFNTYVAPWAQPQSPQQPHDSQYLAQPWTQPQPPSPQSPLQSHNPQFQPQPQSASQPQNLSPRQPQQFQSQSEVRLQPEQDLQNQREYQYASQPTFPGAQPQPESPQYAASKYPPPPWAATPGYFSNQNTMFRQPYMYSTPRPLQNESISSSTRSAAGQKPFIPSYRLFEDLNVLGNTDGRFKATSNGSTSLSGSNSQSMVGGRK